MTVGWKKTNKLDRMKKLLVLGPNTAEKTMEVTPAIRAIRSAYPDVEIHFITRPEWKDYLENNRHIDNCLLYTSPSPRD